MNEQSGNGLLVLYGQDYSRAAGRMGRILTMVRG